MLQEAVRFLGRSVRRASRVVCLVGGLGLVVGGVGFAALGTVGSADAWQTPTTTTGTCRTTTTTTGSCRTTTTTTTVPATTVPATTVPATTVPVTTVPAATAGTLPAVVAPFALAPTTVPVAVVQPQVAPATAVRGPGASEQVLGEQLAVTGPNTDVLTWAGFVLIVVGGMLAVLGSGHVGSTRRHRPDPGDG